MKHVVAAAFLAVGADVDAGVVLVLDRLERCLVQQTRELGGPDLLPSTLEIEAEAVEQRSSVTRVDVARFRIASDDRRQYFSARRQLHHATSDTTRASI